MTSATAETITKRTLQNLTFSSITFAIFDAGLFSHLWSVCVEFQMYLVSPFIVASMIKKGPYFITIPLIVLSVLLSLIIDRAVCSPEILAEVIASERVWLMCGENASLFR